MKLLYASFLCVVLLLFPPCALGQSIQSICDAIKGTFECKAIVTLPTGAVVKECRNKIFTIDPCKTKKYYNYLCPVRSNWRRTCRGWTCVPGTIEKWIDTPCGITIKTKDVNICNTVRDSLGGVGQQLIQKSTAMCQCIPKALDLIGKGLLNEIAATSDVSSAASSILGEFAKLQTCFLDNSFTIQDNKAALLDTGALSPTGGWTVIQAAEIDLSSYINFAEVISPCFVGACNPDLIRAFFTNYLQTSQALMSQQFIAFLTPWTTLLDGIKQEMKYLTGAFDTLAKEAGTVQDEINKIRGELCKDVGTCAEETVVKFYAKVSESLTLEQEFVKAKDAVEGIVETISKLIKLIENVLNALEAIPDANSLLELITSGQLKKIGDIGKALQIGKDLPKLVDDLTQALPTVTKFVVELEPQGSKLLDSLNEIVSNVWLDDPQVTNEVAKNGRESILRIQTLFRGQIFSILQDFTAKFTRIYSALTSLPFHGRSLSMDVSVASYQRWSAISFDLPCTRSKRQKFTVAGGFSGSFDYPEFYTCPYSNKIEWPNHHIPYIKLRFGGPTAHQLASFAAFAPDANGTEDGNRGPAASSIAAPMPTVTFAPDATPAPSTTAAAPPDPTNVASFQSTPPGNSTVTVNVNVNGTGTGEGETTYPALVGNSTPGDVNVTVTYFGNGSFAGQFEEVKGEVVGLQM